MLACSEHYDEVFARFDGTVREADRDKHFLGLSVDQCKYCLEIIDKVIEVRHGYRQDYDFTICILLQDLNDRVAHRVHRLELHAWCIFRI